MEEVAALAAGWGTTACPDTWAESSRSSRDMAYAGGRFPTKGQAVRDDPIDQRHRGILPDSIWGNGEPEGVRQRAAVEMKHTARLVAALGASTVVGFTGSSIWKYVAMFPPVAQSLIDDDFAHRWNPILDVFDDVVVRFAHEVHPREIAYG